MLGAVIAVVVVFATMWLLDARSLANVRQLPPNGMTTGPRWPGVHVTSDAARGRPSRTRASMDGVAVGIAVAVASSRVLLRVHWLSDVVAGLAIGWGWFVLCAIAFGGRMLLFGAPLEVAAEVPGAKSDVLDPHG